MLRRNLLVGLMAVASWGVMAEPGLVTLAKNPPVWNVVEASDQAGFKCRLLMLKLRDQMRLTQYQAGNPGPAYLDLGRCIDREKDVPKPQLIEALKYLSDKPNSAKALKDYYLKWTASIDSMLPGMQETMRAHSTRMDGTTRALEESKRALELELALGM